MNIPHTCPKCGAILPADAPEGLCPACLMSGAFPTGAGTVKMIPSQKPDAPEPSTPTPEELAPLFPQLEILELLGRGGMGAVYKARQKTLNRIVALKILPVEAGTDVHFAERFQREAQALARLNHPNIVTVYEVGESNGLFYFLMEFVDGANLRALIRGGEMKPEAALALIPAFCDALQYAHDEGVVHRDIKPENVLVNKKGHIKIADFGLAKLLGHETTDHALTRTGMYLGTPRYMAPEQVDKPETVDHRADIYSLGVVFYEMLTGEVPMGRFEPPSKKVQIDVKLDEIVLHAMERDVARRYQHVSEIKTDVENVTGKPNAESVASTSASTQELPGGLRLVEWIGILKGCLSVLAIWALVCIIIGFNHFQIAVVQLLKLQFNDLAWNGLLIFGTMLGAAVIALGMLGQAFRGRQQFAWIAALVLVALAVLFEILRRDWFPYLPSAVAIFFGALSFGCFLILRFSSQMPAAFAALTVSRQPMTPSSGAESAVAAQHAKRLGKIIMFVLIFLCATITPLALNEIIGIMVNAAKHKLPDASIGSTIGWMLIQNIAVWVMFSLAISAIVLLKKARSQGQIRLARVTALCLAGAWMLALSVHEWAWLGTIVSLVVWHLLSKPDVQESFYALALVSSVLSPESLNLKSSLATSTASSPSSAADEGS